MRKPAVPAVPKPGESRDRFDQAVKETLEIFRGVRGAKIVPAASTATTEQLAAKINELLDRLQ